MTAPQDLFALALRLGMGKVTQEQMAAFAREVLAGQAAEVERLKATLADALRVVEACSHADMCPRGDDDDADGGASCECSKAELLAILAPDGSAFLARYRDLTSENERLARHHAVRCEELNAATAENARLRSRLEETNREARALLERAENAKVRLQQVTEGLADITESLCRERPVGVMLETTKNAARSIAERHAKALVRARNEGLEKAAAHLRRLGHGGTPSGQFAPFLAAEIDALKEAKS